MKKWSKLLALLLALVVCVCVFAACQTKESTSQPDLQTEFDAIVSDIVSDTQLASILAQSPLALNYRAKGEMYTCEYNRLDVKEKSETRGYAQSSCVNGKIKEEMHRYGTDALGHNMDEIIMPYSDLEWLYREYRDEIVYSPVKHAYVIFTADVFENPMIYTIKIKDKHVVGIQAYSCGINSYNSGNVAEDIGTTLYYDFDQVQVEEDKK